MRYILLQFEIDLTQICLLLSRLGEPFFTLPESQIVHVYYDASRFVHLPPGN